MNFFEPSHLIVVAIIVLLLFGGERLPELMKSVGKGVGELKKGIEEGKRQLSSAIDEHRVEEIKFTPPSDTIEHEAPEDHSLTKPK
ncbi:MAG: twin-arginine translocase TatA/TatE family subunit [Fimbriimonadales bacterium]